MCRPCSAQCRRTNIAGCLHINHVPAEVLHAGAEGRSMMIHFSQPTVLYWVVQGDTRVTDLIGAISLSVFGLCDWAEGLVNDRS